MLFQKRAGVAVMIEQQPARRVGIPVHGGVHDVGVFFADIALGIVDRLARQIAAQNQLAAAQGGRAAADGAAGDPAMVKQSIDNLATGVQSLVQHMRTEQQLLRDWVENQGEQNRRLANAMEDMTQALQNGQTDLFSSRRPDPSPGE